jgi:hypothetical protein
MPVIRATLRDDLVMFTPWGASFSFNGGHSSL